VVKRWTHEGTIMRTIRAIHVSGLALLALGMSLHAEAEPKVLDLGSLGHGFAQAQGVSDNGRVVVGVTKRSGNPSRLADPDVFRAFLWTPATGMRNLGHLRGGGSLASAQAVSADGLVVVGSSDGQTTDGSYFKAHAMRWSQREGLTDLGTLPGGSQSFAQAISADGKVIAGYSEDVLLNDRAVIWQLGGAALDLGTLGGVESQANGISRDGLAVVGDASTAQGSSHAFIWTRLRGMRDLGLLPGMTSSTANAVSADGSVVVGMSSNETQLSPDTHPLKAFIWRSNNGGMTEIVNFLGGKRAMATAVSADGKTVIGTVWDISGEGHAFRWSQANGMTLLPPPNPGLRMAFGRAVSANARFAVGRLTVNSHAFRAELAQ
jgi:probable HAF family extracellular repeat protein